jgi:cobalt/nickel transport system permease protein
MMSPLAAAVIEIRQLDLLALADSPIHRLDARAKVMVTLIFCVTVVSFGRYELSALLPFFIFPAVMSARGNLPPRLIVKKVLLICPLVLIVAAFNPLFDRHIMLQLGPVGITSGWVSFCSILVRAILTVSAALILVGVTGFTAICQALERLGVPRAFVVQLLFLYRYLFVLAEEGARAAQARGLRSFGTRGLGIGSYGAMIGHLLLRTWNRAERIYIAMLARGFQGEFHVRRASRCGAAELVYIVGWSLSFLLMRLTNGPQWLGDLLLRGSV